MPGLVPGIHVFANVSPRKKWMAGHRRAEATPSSTALPGHDYEKQIIVGMIEVV
jgi:hypothetical protein